MSRLLIALVALGAIVGAAGEASAQYYDSYYRSYHPPPPPPPYYRPPYDGPRYRGDRLEDFRPAYVDRHGQMTFYPKRGGRCPRGYTVQDGVCKPYRGY